MQSEKTGAEGTALKKWEITGYGLGGFASTLPNQFKTQFGMSFMTDVAGVPIGIVGILSMAMSVWDAVNDPVIGHIADNTRTKRWGRYRPHMLMGAVGLAATLVLQFVAPPFSGNGRIVYYGVVMALFSVFFTQFTVPWQALNSVMSGNPHQRNQLLVARQLVGAVATSMVGLLAAPLVTSFRDPSAGWIAAAGIIAAMVLLSAGCSIAAAGARDRCGAEKEDGERESLLKNLKKMARNRAVVFAGLMLGAVNFAISINAGISMYYLRCVVGNVKILAVTSGIQILVSLLLVPFLPRLLKKFGKLSILRAAVLLQALGALVLLVLRENASIPQVVFISLLTTTGLTFANICCFALLPDCTDYTRLHFGSAQAGLINATSTFMRKLCGSFSTLLIGGLMGFVGYDVARPVAQSWIRMILGIKISVPLLILAAVMIFSFLYPITAEYEKEMRQELKKRTLGLE